MAGKGDLRPVKGIRKPGASRQPEPEKSAKKSDKAAEKKNDRSKATEGMPKRNNASDRSSGQPRIKRNFSDGKFSRKKNVPIVILCIIGLFALTIFTSFLSYTYLVDRYENPITEESITIDEETKVPFKINKGANSSDIAASLKKADLISSKFIFKLLSSFNGYDSKYSAGTHYLSKGLNYDEIMVILSSEPETVKVTFPEGFTVVQYAERLEKNGVVSKKAFLDAVNSIDVSSYAFVGKTNSQKEYKLEGFLFPDTYEFDINANVEDVIYKMLNNFSTKFLPEYYEMAETMNLSVEEVVILASFVEREAKLAKERATIAGVYVNRIQSEDFKFMQCDATIQYIYRNLNNGETPEKITKEMKEIDSPYNTYLYEGLTPGAICNPSSSSIRAILNYEEHGYYYYVASKDNPKSHIFSETLEQHKIAVEANKVEE